MCRAGGRRCPSHLSDLARRARNAKRRAEYAEQKFNELDTLIDDIIGKVGTTPKEIDALIARQITYKQKMKESLHSSQRLHDEYTNSIAHNALFGNPEKTVPAMVPADIGAATLKKSIESLPPVFGGRAYMSVSGDKLFRDTDEVVSANPELGIYKTKNTGRLADMHYFNPETIRGTIVKSKLTEDSAHTDFGFRRIDPSKEYKIEGFNSLSGGEKNKVISVAEMGKVDPDEQSSVRWFTGGGYAEINDALYGRHDEKEDYVISNHTRGCIDGIDEVLSRSPKRQRYLYRAMNNESGAMENFDSAEDWVDSKFSLGEDVVFDGYQSSTADNKGFQDFASPDGVLFEILTPEGMNVTSNSGFQPECETLLPRDARYKVVGITKGVDLKFENSYGATANNTVVRLVAVNSEGEVLDGSNADEIRELKEQSADGY